MDLNNTLSTLDSSRDPSQIEPPRAREWRHHPTPLAEGFTLIEILIVIVIISIVTGIAALTISRNQQKQYEYLANSLSQLITLAEEEAMLRPATLGLGFTDHSFQFFEYKNIVNTNKTHWYPMTGPLYGLHSFSKQIKLTIKVQDKIMPPQEQPTIIISASGDIVPFIIEIGKEDQKPSYQVTGFASGKVISGIFHEK